MGQGLTRDRAAWSLVQCRYCRLRRKLAVRGKTGVWGPHLLERLANRTDNFQNVFRCDRFTAGGQTPVLDAESEDLQEGERIGTVGEGGINAGAGTKSRPQEIMGVLCIGIFRTNAAADLVPNKAEVSAPFIGRRSLH